jgi:hypothetical protein
MPLVSVPLVLGLEHSETLDDSSATSKAFRFTLDHNALALITGHTGGSDGAWEAHWVLRDAAGLLTGHHGYWNSYEASTDVLTLAAGDYTLEVSLDYGRGGSIAVRVDSGTNAIQVVAEHSIGERISFGDSDAGIYRVDFAAGDEYLLQAANGSEWSIHGTDFLQADLLADGAVLRFVPSQDGSWYFVRRRDFAGDSSLSIERPQPPITLDSRIAGQLPANDAGEAQHSYRLRLTERKLLYLDVEKVDSPLQITFYEGNTWLRAIYAYTTSRPLEPLALEAGEYRIEVQTIAATSGDTAYAMRLFDLAKVPTLSLNTAVYGRLQAGEAAIYAVDLSAGTPLDYQPGKLGGLYGWWRLLRSDGAQVAAGSLDETRTTVAAPPPGHYFLVWDSEQQSAAGGEAEYRFALKTTQLIALGEQVGAEAFAATASAAYRFSVPTATRVLIDLARSESDSAAFTWRISRDGQLIDQGRLASAASLDDRLPIVELPAGSYHLAFTADTDLHHGDDFAFRLLDLAQAQPLSRGAWISGERLAGQVAVFSFVAAAGDCLTLEEHSGDSERWWLLDEFGQELARGQGTGSAGPLARNGTYFLLRDDGSDTDTGDGATNRHFAFTVSNDEGPAPALTLNSHRNCDARRWRQARLSLHDQRRRDTMAEPAERELRGPRRGP